VGKEAPAFTATELMLVIATLGLIPVMAVPSVLNSVRE
jgi:Tfp pilus assembly protein FimT